METIGTLSDLADRKTWALHELSVTNTCTTPSTKKYEEIVSKVLITNSRGQQRL